EQRLPLRDVVLYRLDLRGRRDPRPLVEILDAGDAVALETAPSRRAARHGVGRPRGRSALRQPLVSLPAGDGVEAVLVVQPAHRPRRTADGELTVCVRLRGQR